MLKKMMKHVLNVLGLVQGKKAAGIVLKLYTSTLTFLFLILNEKFYYSYLHLKYYRTPL